MLSTLLLSITLVLLGPQVSAQECWESCFNNNGPGTGNPGNILKLAAAEIRDLVAKYNIQGINFLLDTTLANFHDTHDSSDKDSGERIFRYQKDIAGILSFLATGPQDQDGMLYITQYDEGRAWAFSYPQCLNACYFSDALDLLTGVEYLDSDYDGNGHIEKACNLAHYIMKINQFACTLLDQDAELMAVAITNSHIHDHVDSPHVSYCKDYFNTRLAIGIHRAKGDDMDDWQSGEPQYFKLWDHPTYMTRARALLTCMNNACSCDTDGNIVMGQYLQTTGGHDSNTIQVLPYGP